MGIVRHRGIGCVAKAVRKHVERIYRRRRAEISGYMAKKYTTNVKVAAIVSRPAIQMFNLTQRHEY